MFFSCGFQAVGNLFAAVDSSSSSLHRFRLRLELALRAKGGASRLRCGAPGTSRTLESSSCLLLDPPPPPPPLLMAGPLFYTNIREELTGFGWVVWRQACFERSGEIGRDRERSGEIERDRETDREKDREKDRGSAIERSRQTETKRHRDVHGMSDTDVSL